MLGKLQLVKSVTPLQVIKRERMKKVQQTAFLLVTNHQRREKILDCNQMQLSGRNVKVRLAIHLQMLI